MLAREGPFAAFFQSSLYSPRGLTARPTMQIPPLQIVCLPRCLSGTPTVDRVRLGRAVLEGVFEGVGGGATG